jgi:diketogulonate reductase-like aldo/keto reductase
VGDPLNHPTVITLAEKHGRTPAQIVLLCHIDHGSATIPKSFRPGRIAENIAIFDFTLTADDIAAIDVMDMGLRGGPYPDRFDLGHTNIQVEN